MIVRLDRTDEKMERNPIAEIMREFINEVVYNATHKYLDEEEEVIDNFASYVWDVISDIMVYYHDLCDRCGDYRTCSIDGIIMCNECRTEYVLNI